jgi:hypothetical protein
VSERTVKGRPESHWDGFAICDATAAKIRELCKPGWILEFGSGTGTRRLSVDYDILTIEHDPDWMIYPIGTPRIIQVLAPLRDGWYHRRIVAEALEGWRDAQRDNRLTPKMFNGVLIDGPSQMIGRDAILNPDNFEVLRPFLNCPIFIDDTHREKEHNLAIEITRRLDREVATFDCNDPEKPGVKFSVIT